MNSAAEERQIEIPPTVYTEDSFSRLDETDDAVFYARDRFVSHIDARARETVRRLIGALVKEREPVILDLMAGWDSHLPDSLASARVVGLGLNENELRENESLQRFVLHDVNRDPVLPFDDATFDVVLNTVSVDYMTRPFEVFREVGRILKPGGLFLVIFSNRMFPQKAVKIWRESSEEERILLVEDFFLKAGVFADPQVFASRGKPRPRDDKYAPLGIPSDPVYAVFAVKAGPGGTQRRRLPEGFDEEPGPPAEVLEARRARIKETLECPHCGVPMKKWRVPQTPFTEWDNEFMYICFNDACPYLVRGWKVMEGQGNFGFSYRQMYNPDRDVLLPVPVPNLRALRESIVEEDETRGL